MGVSATSMRSSCDTFSVMLTGFELAATRVLPCAAAPVFGTSGASLSPTCSFALSFDRVDADLSQLAELRLCI